MPRAGHGSALLLPREDLEHALDALGDQRLALASPPAAAARRRAARLRGWSTSTEITISSTMIGISGLGIAALGIDREVLVVQLQGLDRDRVAVRVQVASVHLVG